MKKDEPKLMLVCFPFTKNDMLTKGKEAKCECCGLKVWSSDS